ncbi:MAG: precorrin-2 C(20)-methyltransferase [Flavobacteriales bacterium]
MGKNNVNIYGIALGPGEPQLISLKGYNLLHDVDVVYFPGSLTVEGKQYSFSKNILQQLKVDENKCRGIFIQMSGDRKQAKQAYLDAFYSIKNELQKGKKIAIVSEGDISFYSTFSYLLELFQSEGILVSMIPGIPSFLSASSAHQFPLCRQDENAAILARPVNINKVEKAITEYDTVVIMKINRIKEKLVNYLSQKELEVFYGEYLGTEHQYITRDIDKIKERKVPYMALLIIKWK